MNFKIIGKYKPLCNTKYGLLLYKKEGIYLLDGKSESITLVVNIFFSGIKKFISKFRLGERAMRLYARASIEIDEGALVSFNKSIYYVNINKKTITKEHTYRAGMNNPLSFARIHSINGFENCIAYGEYTANPNKEAVAIYARYNNMWRKVYEFPTNTIKHIHAIIPDAKNSRVLILTGDDDRESGFWAAYNNFSKVEPLMVGKQAYRSCTALPVENGILYATDTPFEDNYIYFAYEKDGIWINDKLYQINGPCIFNVHNHDRLIISTSVEPPADINGIRYLLSRKVAPGIKKRETQVVIGNKEGGFKVIARFKKDFFPMALFEFGNVIMVDGSDNTIYLYPVSVKKFDGKLLKVNLEG